MATTKYRMLYLSLFVLFLGACQSAHRPDSGVPTSTLKTMTPTPMATITPASLQATDIPVTPSLTPMPTPTPEPLVVPEPTLTPLPTIPPDDVQQAIKALLASPFEGCSQPCWWQAVPGKTTASQIIQFLDRYHIAYYPPRYDENNNIYYIETEYTEIEEADKNEVNGFRTIYAFEAGTLKHIYVSHSTTVDVILEKYGMPDEIWVSTGYYAYYPLPFSVDLLYFDKGVGISYTLDGYLEDGIVTGCFAHTFGKLNLYRPDLVQSHQDFFWIYMDETPYLPLSEATNVKTIEAFVAKFSTLTSESCLETPMSLWDW